MKGISRPQLSKRGYPVCSHGSQRQSYDQNELDDKRHVSIAIDDLSKWCAIVPEEDCNHRQYRDYERCGCRDDQPKQKAGRRTRSSHGAYLRNEPARTIPGADDIKQGLVAICEFRGKDSAKVRGFLRNSSQTGCKKIPHGLKRSQRNSRRFAEKPTKS